MSILNHDDVDELLATNRYGFVLKRRACIELGYCTPILMIIIFPTKFAIRIFRQALIKILFLMVQEGQKHDLIYWLVLGSEKNFITVTCSIYGFRQASIRTTGRFCRLPLSANFEIPILRPSFFHDGNSGSTHSFYDACGIDVDDC